MINGLYSGASALDVLSKQHEIISSNLAHANSSGHRRVQSAFNQRFDVTNENASPNLGPEIRDVTRDFQNGRSVPTQRPLDVALNGDGFFVFDNEGDEILSRDGRLFRNPDTGVLVNEKGFPIQGETGPITIDPTVGDRDISIATDGTVSADGTELGKLRVVTFENNQSLLPVGVTGFKQNDNAQEIETDASVTQFHHELSNVQPVSELITLIVNTRHYEAVQKATRTLSDALQDYIRQ